MTQKTLLILVLVFFLIGCASITEEGTPLSVVPTQMPTADIAETAVPATSTVMPPPPTFTPLPTTAPTSTPTTAPTETPTATVTATATATATALPTATAVTNGASTIIGYSAGGRAITAVQFGGGPDQVIFIGGIHGGYEWNSILLAYQTIDYFLENPTDIPPNITLTIIPAANPDGQYTVTGKEGVFTTADLAVDTTPGRFNANNVDLNRNWDCNWQPFGLWRNQEVSAGPFPFSEPENIALRDFIMSRNPVATVFFHSALNAIFTAGCPDTLPTSREIADVYAAAANYPVYEQFTSYAVTGDAGDWLATQGIPSFTVELKNHSDLDWSQNLAGMLNLLTYFAAE